MQIHFKSAFENMSSSDINKWIDIYRERLIGSAIFTSNNSFGSKIVRWAENWGKDSKKFTPSHTASIVNDNGILYSFDMKPLKATRQPLSNYIMTTDDDFVLIMRDFELNTKMFSANILEHLGEFYPYLSAIRSVFTKRQSKWRRHCSELHLRELQKQGLFKDVNPEITPEELYNLFKKD